MSQPLTKSVKLFAVLAAVTFAIAVLISISSSAPVSPFVYGIAFLFLGKAAKNHSDPRYSQLAMNFFLFGVVFMGFTLTRVLGLL